MGLEAVSHLKDPRNQTVVPLQVPNMQERTAKRCSQTLKTKVTGSYQQRSELNKIQSAVDEPEHECQLQCQFEVPESASRNCKRKGVDLHCTSRFVCSLGTYLSPTIYSIPVMYAFDYTYSADRAFPETNYLSTNIRSIQRYRE